MRNPDDGNRGEEGDQDMALEEMHVITERHVLYHLPVVYFPRIQRTNIQLVFMGHAERQALFRTLPPDARRFYAQSTVACRNIIDSTVSIRDVEDRLVVMIRDFTPDELVLFCNAFPEIWAEILNIPRIRIYAEGMEAAHGIDLI